MAIFLAFPVHHTGATTQTPVASCTPQAILDLAVLPVASPAGAMLKLDASITMPSLHLANVAIPAKLMDSYSSGMYKPCID